MRGTQIAGRQVANAETRRCPLAGLTREEFDIAAKDILQAWEKAQTRDAGLQVIIEYGRKYGYKNVMAALQKRVPKQFEREKSVETWQSEQQQNESLV